MKKFTRLIILLLAFSAHSCTLLKEVRKEGFGNDLYIMEIRDTNLIDQQSVYVEQGADTLLVYIMYRDTALARDTIALPSQVNEKRIFHYTFAREAFDFDIITISLKLRPQEGNFPPQLNTNFNGNIYIGFGKDNYEIDYLETPISTFNQKITHYIYSWGIFGGIGTTTMNPWVTNNAIQIEYDGFIALAGISGTAAINDFTFGLGIGIDFLLDKNREFWIYNNEPWLGLTFGVNLN